MQPASPDDLAPLPPSAPAPPAREKAIRGWKAILAAVRIAIDEKISDKTVRRWATIGAVHRLPVQCFPHNRAVFLLPSHLDMWVSTRALPVNARPPGRPVSEQIRPTVRQRATTPTGP